MIFFAIIMFRIYVKKGQEEEDTKELEATFNKLKV